MKSPHDLVRAGETLTFTLTLGRATDKRTTSIFIAGFGVFFVGASAAALAVSSMASGKLLAFSGLLVPLALIAGWMWMQRLRPVSCMVSREGVKLGTWEADRPLRARQTHDGLEISTADRTFIWDVKDPSEVAWLIATLGEELQE